MSDGRRDPTDATPARPVVLGSLGRAMAGLLGRPQTIALIAGPLVTILVASMVLPGLAVPLGETLPTPLALAFLALVAWVIFVLGTAAVAILPPLLLRGRDQSVFAAHAWIGARETRRAFGRAARTIGLPHDPASAATWLARTPSTDRNRPVRIEALMLAGQFDGARREVALLPEATPLDAYRKREAEALIEDQTGGEVDEAALQAAADAIPPGIDRTEAAVSLAVFRARRRLPDGDWRAPLFEVRPEIPGSNVRILLADFGLPVFEILMRRVVIPITVIVVLLAVAGFVLPAVPP